MDNHILAKIKVEIEQIDTLFVVYADLFANVQQHEPTLVETTACASVLHSFYNGLENIFNIIAKEIDHDSPTGPQSHRNLLNQMMRATSTREAVLTTGLGHRLADYLGFRHFYRHSYSFFLDWSEMERLVLILPEIWSETKLQLKVSCGIN